MTINYDVSENDYINFNMYSYEQSGLMKKTNILTVIGSLLILFFAIRIGLRNPNVYDTTSASNIIASIIVGIVLSLLFIFTTKLTFKPITKWGIKTQLRDGKLNDFIGPQTVTLHNDFIEDGNVHMTTQIKYSAVEKICCAYGCLFIYIGATKALIIPLRCFADAGQRRDFAVLLKQKTGHDIIRHKQKGASL